MTPSAELLSNLQSVLPVGRWLYRLSIRRGDSVSEGVETGDPAAALAGHPGFQGLDECRVEIADGAGKWSTLVPYFRLFPTPAGNPVTVGGPRDEAGMPVRVMLYDEAERGYIADYALFGGVFVFDAAILPVDHLLRLHFLHWSLESRSWRPAGPARRLAGTGKLGGAQIRAEHRLAAAGLLERVKTSAAYAQGKPGQTFEFYDDVDFLSDAPADAGDQDLLETLAELVAGSSVLALRIRLVSFREDGSKVPGPLAPVWNLEPAFTALFKLLHGARELRPVAVGLLDLTREDDGPALVSLLKTFLFRVLPEGLAYQTRDWRPGPIHDLCAEWAQRPGASLLIGEALNYIRAYVSLTDAATAGGGAPLTADYLDPNHLRDCIEPALTAMDDAPEGANALYGPSIFRAKLESLRDRERACVLFEQALAIDSPIREACAFDDGARTYLSQSRLDAKAGDLAARHDAALGALTTVSAPPPDRPGPVWLFSCDLRFLRIYMPHWLGVADYCKARGVDLHFILAGPPRDTAEAMLQIEQLRRALAGFRDADPETFDSNITLSTWPVPDWCAEPRTFYACARYLGMGELSKRFSRDILIQDMDFTLTEDPAKFMAHFPQPGFGIQPSRGLYGIDAWRRFMGGAFFAPNNDGARRDLRAMEHYLVEGLTAERSWYLDQNALSYLFERTSRSGETPFWSIKIDRPTQQPRSNSLYESLQP